MWVSISVAALGGVTALKFAPFPPETPLTVALYTARMIPDLPTPPQQEGVTHSGLRYRIVGTVQPTVILNLDKRHAVYTDAGGLSWITASVSMDTGMQGGLLSGLTRMVSGSTAFLITLRTDSNGQAAFSADFPGKVVALELGSGERVIMHKHAFVCAEQSVKLDVTFTRRFGAGLVGGDGFVLQQLTGPGAAFVEMDGDAIEYRLARGETLLVEPGHVAMFEPSVEFSVELLRGVRNLLFSGENLFFARLTGPGRVWLNSMTASKLAQRIGQHLPGH